MTLSSEMGIAEQADTAPTLDERLRAAVDGVAKDTLANTAIDRTDRLWPADVLVYQTNPLSLAYGACGTALVLLHTMGGVPVEVERWLLSHPLSVDSYPPGLYVGLAGIARAFAWMGQIERAEEVMRLAYTSPLLFDEMGVDHGMSGWGLASLAMHAASGDARHLDYALLAGERLLANAVQDRDGRYWPTRFDGKVYLGYAYGTCGIATFLLRLAEVTGDPKFRTAAVEGMDFTLSRGSSEPNKLQWPSYVGARITYPYWRLGSAGIGSALLRFHAALQNDRYLAAARRVASAVRMLFASVPGQFDGMSSVGDFLLDMYAATGEWEYYQQARVIAESILCFQVPSEAGVAFPGRLLMRLSCDYSHGSAGTAAFLHRVLAPASRTLDWRLYAES